MGITHRRAVLILYACSSVFTAAAIAVSIGRQWQAGVAILAAAAGMIGIVRFVGYFEHIHLVRRQRARIRSRHTEALRFALPKLGAALQRPRDEDDVFRVLERHLEEAQVLACDVLVRDGEKVVRSWTASTFSTARLGEYVSARFPLSESGHHDVRFRWNSEYGEVTPQTEILLQVVADVVSSALIEVRSELVPARVSTPAAPQRALALSPRSGV
jgi:hypothetical protein